MNNTAPAEELVPLTEEDRSMLKKSRLNYLLLTVLLLGIGIALGITGFYYYRGTGIGLLIMKLFFAFCTLIGALICYSFLSLTHKDLKENQKRLITGPVEDKRMGSFTYQSDYNHSKRADNVTMNFYLKLNGKEYYVPDTIYLELRVGDMVQVQIAPNSEKALRWRILKDRNAKDI